MASVNGRGSNAPIRIQPSSSKYMKYRVVVACDAIHIGLLGFEIAPCCSYSGNPNVANDYGRSNAHEVTIYTTYTHQHQPLKGLEVCRRVFNCIET